MCEHVWGVGGVWEEMNFCSAPFISGILETAQWFATFMVLLGNPIHNPNATACVHYTTAPEP